MAGRAVQEPVDALVTALEFKDEGPLSRETYGLVIVMATASCISDPLDFVRLPKVMRDLVIEKAECV